MLERGRLSGRCWRGEVWAVTPGFWMKDLRLGRETEAWTLLVAGGRDTEALGSS